MTPALWPIFLKAVTFCLQFQQCHAIGGEHFVGEQLTKEWCVQSRWASVRGGAMGLAG